VVRAANASRQTEFRNQIPGQSGPPTVFASRRQFTNDGAVIVDGKRSAKLPAGFTFPLDQERILLHARFETGCGLVACHIAGQFRGSEQSDSSGSEGHDEQRFHG